MIRPGGSITAHAVPDFVRHVLIGGGPPKQRKVEALGNVAVQFRERTGRYFCVASCSRLDATGELISMHLRPAWWPVSTEDAGVHPMCLRHRADLKAAAAVSDSTATRGPMSRVEAPYCAYLCSIQHMLRCYPT